VKLPDDSSAVTGTLACTLKYTVKDCDPATGLPDDEEGYADEFVVRLFYLIIPFFFCIDLI
jgi:coatomer protein complex subunit gamma